jgi:hypothetical protein
MSGRLVTVIYSLVAEPPTIQRAKGLKVWLIENRREVVALDEALGMDKGSGRDAGGLESSEHPQAHQRNQYIFPANFRHVSSRNYNYRIKSHQGKAYMRSRTTTE